MVWLLFALLGNFFYACSGIIDQLLRKKHVKHNASVTILWLVFFFFVWLAIVPFIHISVPAAPKILAALVAGFMVLMVALPYFYAISVEEVSKVVPVWQLSSVFVLVISAVFLGEALLPRHYYGFAAMLLGGLLLGIDMGKGGFKMNKAVLAVAAASVMLAVHLVLIKFFYTTESFWNGFFWIPLGSFAGAAFLALLPGNFKRVKGELLSLTKLGFGLLLASTIVTFLADVSLLLAIKKGPVSLVSVIGGTQMMFLFVMTVIISRYFPRILKENISRKALLTKFGAIALMIVGLYLIS